MRYGLKNREQEFSNVVGQLCLDNIGSSITNLPQFIGQHYAQGSTEPTGGIAFIGHTLGVLTRRVTAETVMVYGHMHNYFMPTGLSSGSISEDDQASTLENLHVSLERAYTSELVERLKFLAEPSEDINEPTLSYGSLKQFIGFIKTYRLQQPDLVLSFDGNVRAEWRQDSAHHFVAEFVPNGFVKFVVFVQSTISSKQIERMAGTTSLEKLVAIMETTGAKWCFE